MHRQRVVPAAGALEEKVDADDSDANQAAAPPGAGIPTATTSGTTTPDPEKFRFLHFESTWHVTSSSLRLSTVVPKGGPR
jgi:hypothetical protein